MAIPKRQTPFFDLKTLAKSLELKSIDVIKTSGTDIESHWFRSKGPADLYFWRAENRIVKQQVSLYNQVIQWNEYDGVKTGYVNDDRSLSKKEVICFDEEVNKEVVAQAIELLQNAGHLEKALTKQLIRHFEFYNQWQGLQLRLWLKKLLRRFFKAP